MQEASVSILMPVKNTSLFLNDCIDSILNQSFSDWELLAINDNSTDNSLEILQDYEHKDSRIKVLNNENPGIINALRTAYSNCNGKFITRMDSDDIMAPKKLELLREQLIKENNKIIVTGYVKYFGDNELGEGYINYENWLNDLTRKETNFDDIYKECTIPSPCWMVSKKNLELCGAFRSDVYPEDYDLAFRFRKYLTVKSVKSVLHHWRDYQNRTSRTDDNYSDNRFSELKIEHFLSQDYQHDTPLILMGAGNKGKQIARLLSDRGVNFRWLCNNENKIGRDIYGTRLENNSQLTNSHSSQIIIAISSKAYQAELNQLIQGNKQHSYFRFC